MVRKAIFSTFRRPIVDDRSNIRCTRWNKNTPTRKSRYLRRRQKV